MPLLEGVVEVMGVSNHICPPIISLTSEQGVAAEGTIFPVLILCFKRLISHSIGESNPILNK